MPIGYHPCNEIEQSIPYFRVCRQMTDDSQVARAVEELLGERELVYHDLLLAQNDASQKILAALARERKVPKPTSAGFLAGGHLGGASTVRAALRDLEKKDLVYKDDGGWMVYDFLFADYLRSLQGD